MNEKSLSDPARLLGAGLLSGLYLSRVLLEFGLPDAGIFPVFIIGLALGIIIGIGLAYCSDAKWPALFLLFYVLSPTVNPALAVVAGATALGAWLAVLPLPDGLGWDILVLLAAFAVYTATAAPGLLPADEGELQSVLAKPGIAHPPGYPFYTMTGWTFNRFLPAGPARNANLFSAFTAALTLAVVSHATRRETGSPLAGLAAAFTLGAATSFWSTATQAGVRPMTALFVALIIDALLAYRRDEEKALPRFALCLGLGITHHASILFVAVVFGLALLAADWSLLREPRRWLKPGAAFALGLLPWLYLPLRAATLGPSATRLGADLSTWQGFWQHTLARGFAGDLFYFRSPGELLDRLRTLTSVLAFQWHALVPTLALFAGLMMLWRARWLLFALGGAFGLHTLITATYRAPQTVEYMVPAYVCLAVAVGWLAGKMSTIRKGPGIVGLIFAGAALTFGANLPGMAYRAEDTYTRRFAERLLDAAPPEAVLLANWHWSTPLWYLQEIEDRRPDVEVSYVYPEGAEPMAETWTRRINEYLAKDRPIIVQGYYPGAYAASGYIFDPRGPGWLVRETPRHDLPPGLPEMAIDFEGGLSLAGGPYIETLGGYAPVEVTLAWRVNEPAAQDVTSFVHAVDEAGRVVRQADVLLPTAQAQSGDILLARYTLDRLPSGVELLAGLYTWQAGGIEPLSTQEGDARVAIAHYDAAPNGSLPAVTEHPRHDRFEDGLILTGYDYDLSLPGRPRLYLHWKYEAPFWADYDITLSMRDTVLDEARFRAYPGIHFSTAHDLPPDTEGVRLALQAADCLCVQRVKGPFGLAAGYTVDLPGPASGDRYVPLGSGIVLTGVSVEAPLALTPGARVTVALRFRAAYPLAEDDVVKVDLIETGWAWRVQSDHIPATGAIPTLKWTWGRVVIDRHTLIVPETAEGRRAKIDLLLYDHFTGRPLPILDPDLAAQGQTLTIWQNE